MREDVIPVMSYMRIFMFIGGLFLALLVGAGGFVGYDLYKFSRGSFEVDLSSVVGFADRYSYEAGKPVTLSIHTSAPARLVIRRLERDWVDVGEPITVPVSLQNPVYHKKRGFNWEPNLTVDTDGLAPGLYQFRLEQSDDPTQNFAIPIIIKDSHTRPIGVVLSTKTWDAYNVFGGTSHYEIRQFNWLTQKIVVDFWFRYYRGINMIQLAYVPRARPNALFNDEANVVDLSAPYTSFLVRTELELLTFLQREGYDINVYSDEDLADDPHVLQSKVLVFPGHSEYWSDDMFFALERYMKNGGRVFKSIAGLEHQVQTGDEWRIRGNTPDSEIARLVGVATNMDGQLTAAPYKVLCPAMWVFQDTGLGAGDIFGEDSLNRPSFDLAGHKWLKDIVDLNGQPQKGASGIFTSKVTLGSGAFSLLARGTNPRGGADMVYRDLPGGGWVFNASSHTFNGALPIDQIISQIVRNLMDEAIGKLQRPPGTLAC